MQSLIQQWRESKTPKDHLFILKQSFDLKLDQETFAGFLNLFEVERKIHEQVALKILSYLSFGDVLAISFVNKRLHSLCKEHQLLEKFAKARER